MQNSRLERVGHQIPISHLSQSGGFTIFGDSLRRPAGLPHYSHACGWVVTECQPHLRRHILPKENAQAEYPDNARNGETAQLHILYYTTLSHRIPIDALGYNPSPDLSAVHACAPHVRGASALPTPTSPATAATSNPVNPSAGEVYLVELGILLAMSSDA
jgi:hypothetical protein